MTTHNGSRARRRALAAIAALGLIAGIAVATTPSARADAARPAAAVTSDTRPAAPLGSRYACGPATPGHATCLALQRVDTPGVMSPDGETDPDGYDPIDLDSAYNLTSVSPDAGKGETVAVVDADDDPNAESDLAVYRSDEGLSPCTTDNGCFRKVNEWGDASDYPSPDKGWAGEESLDLDMVSAICPNCHILLVETEGSADGDLGNGVDAAVDLGAKFVSNSYGSEEGVLDSSWSQHYEHPGVVITVSSGDFGYMVQFPADLPDVIAVGGTSLLHASTPRGWAEIAWGGAGSGCSAYGAKPAWQTDSGCGGRTVADVSAVADPATGVSIYDSYQQTNPRMVYGGTSVASPIIAAIYALGGNPTANYPAETTYAKAVSDPSSFNDIVGGTNDGIEAGTCGGSARYLCNAVKGYDGPTGWGTPNGIAAFTP